MLFGRAIIIALFCGVCCCPAETEGEGKMNPETVLISRFSFQRPPNWQWIETRSNPQQIQQSVEFRVKGSQDQDECAVYIHHFAPEKPAGSRAVTAKRWRGSFKGIPDSVDFDAPLPAGRHKVYYMEIKGTHAPENPRNKKEQSRSNMTQCGAVVEDAEGNLVFRLIGPTPLVEKAKPEFKKMIENALKEE